MNVFDVIFQRDVFPVVVLFGIAASWAFRIFAMRRKKAIAEQRAEARKAERVAADAARKVEREEAEAARKAQQEAADAARKAARQQQGVLRQEEISRIRQDVRNEVLAELRKQSGNKPVRRRKPRTNPPAPAGKPEPQQ